jgi:hypothetical protein
MKNILLLTACALLALGACSENKNLNNNNGEICDDAIDNDGDGHADCDDQDCEEAPACTTHPDCGNGLIDADEECDGTDLNGKSCETLGLGAGTLTCNECALDTRGCGNNALKIYQSGSRMKMRVGTSPDGSKDFRGWYDTQLEINCVFRKTANGPVRCIPELTSLNDRWYADANCIVRHAVLPAEDTDLILGTIISMEVSSGKYRVYQVTERIAGQVYDNSQGMCAQWPAASANSSVDIYGIAPVDDTVYQLQEETVE